MGDAHAKPETGFARANQKYEQLILTKEYAYAVKYYPQRHNKMAVDAIVNAANTKLVEGGGVCGAIFSAAGAEKLQAACNLHAPIKTGEAAITSGFALPAKHIIHAVGPVYQDGKHGEESLLRSCYINALDLAKMHNCESIAFPLISSGIYGYPKDKALAVATKAISDWLLTGDMDVSLVVFDKTSFAVSKALHSRTA